MLSLVVFASLLSGLVRGPCVVSEWDDGRQFGRLCYTDLIPLYVRRGLGEGSLPYLEAPNEYPVGTGLFMALAAIPADDPREFFVSASFLLALCAMLTAGTLHRLVGDRSLLFAAAPPLVLGGFLNFDLLPVALSTAGAAAFLARRDLGAGILLGLGVASKVYPAIFLLPFAAERLRRPDRAGALALGGGAAGAWLALNVPIAVLAWDRWTEFFRFNATRAPTLGTLWAVGCRGLTGQTWCPAIGVVNAASAVALLGGVALLWRAAIHRRRDLPRWTLCLPLLVLFLLTNKVYSPQYDLWLLPWVALVVPHLGLWLAFAAADAAVFATEFSALGRLAGWGGVSLDLLALAVVVRGVVLGIALVLWWRRWVASAPEEDHPL